MFDVGFQEIVLIGIIALLVIGPERLPSVARSVGLWVGKVQRFVAGVKTDIRNELQNDELRGLLNNQEDQIRELKETLTETRNEFARTASMASTSLSDGMSSAVEQVRGAAEAVKDGAADKPADLSTDQAAKPLESTSVNSATDTELKPASTDTELKPASNTDTSDSADSGKSV